MKRKIKIGIPRTFPYYEKKIQCKKFFEKLGCNTILSPETNEKIEAIYSNKKMCENYNNFLCHIKYLDNICDFVVVPFSSNKKNNCPCYIMAYDNAKEIIPKNKIIEYNLNKLEIIEYLNMGLNITINIPKVIISYFYGRKKQKDYIKNEHNKQKNLISKSNKKILILAPEYILENKIIMKNILNILNVYNIIPIYSNKLDKSISKFFSDYSKYKISTNYYKETIGAYYFYKYQIDGIIQIINNKCKNNVLINNIIKKNIKDKLLLTLYLNEINTSKDKILEYIKKIKGAYYE